MAILPCHAEVAVTWSLSSHFVKPSCNPRRRAAAINSSPPSPTPPCPRQLCFPFLAHILCQIFNQVPTS
ncbi:hypothetical protein GYH30_004034 [Glycine max]|nr:hypothetical protein GYH30_004034 [Glycine max]